MTTDMGTTPQMDATPPAGGQNNRQRNIIIGVVVAVILLCCCCIALVGGYWLFQNGDRFFGQQSQLLPLLLRM